MANWLTLEQQQASSAELYGNLALSGLSVEKLAEQLGWLPPRVQRALDVSGADPADVWALRDAVFAAASQAGFDPIEFSVLTDDYRVASKQWAGLGSPDPTPHPLWSTNPMPFEVRLFPEWGDEFSLWPPLLGPSVEQLGLSAESLSWLRRWTTFWRTHVDLNRDEFWSTPEDQAAWEADGDALAHQLQRELLGYAVVVADFRYPKLGY